MIIERKITPYVINAQETIFAAINKITQTKGRILFVVEESGLLVGLFTNGDLLRWLSLQHQVDLQQPLLPIINQDYRVVKAAEKSERIREHLEQVLFVPIIDNRGRLVAVARRRKSGEGIKIGNHSISSDSAIFVIAEIGNNHNGSLTTAKKLIDMAVSAGADCAKFQMRNLETLYCNTGDPNDACENLGTQYTLDLLSRFQLDQNEMFKAFDYCQEKGIVPLCTPWDKESVDLLETYGLSAYKIASADFTNHDLLTYAAQTGKPLICSTGMSTEVEIKETLSLLKNIGAQYILLHCNSTYPAPFKDVNLEYISNLQELGDCPVGYSGHERGASVAIASVAKGAKIIEKHLTLDRKMEGSDHKISLLPKEFEAMVGGIRQVEQALGASIERTLSQGELINRVSLAKSLVATCDIKPGQRIEADMIDVKSPGQGLQPNRKKELLGAKSVRDIKKGDFFYPSDLITEKISPRPYAFKRPWGIPVRYHDFSTIITDTNPDLLEFHLSYKDLEIDVDSYFDSRFEVDLVVHSPELFSGDHVMDLCSPDQTYRDRSIKELKRVVAATKCLKSFFPNAVRPLIVTNVGGFSEDAPLGKNDVTSRYALLLDSLGQIDSHDVEIIPQTMPPFPWHFGGQRYHNLFVDPEEIIRFCAENDYRVCLDVSHSKLACNHFKWSFKRFIEEVGPHTAHLHIADSKNEDGEGLQLGDGDIDFMAMAEDLNSFAPKASFIPEIWQGHENGGEGFWVALNKLENLL